MAYDMDTYIEFSIESDEAFYFYNKGRKIAATVKAKTVVEDRTVAINLLIDFLTSIVNSEEAKVSTHKIYAAMKRTINALKHGRNSVSFNGGGHISYAIKVAEPKFDFVLGT